MPQLIPAILVHDAVTFAKRLHAVEAFVDLVQIDVLNNTFIERTSWADPAVIAKIETKIGFELHLMTAEPEVVAAQWKKVSNVRRVIFHLEATDDPARVIQAILKLGWKVGIAINPETPLGALELYLDRVEVVLFLGVHPGESGRVFLPETIERLREFSSRAKRPLVGIDGGVNHETIPALKAAGAELFYAGSEIFEKRASPEEAINELKTLIA
ncbi:MAG: ribulose-phosphate 3-epimerase [Candidatus Magasanikbacteria bacterium]|nr:ribulose-phosphate 3-epimerase [Candidatus Magasanikbacteria bacterium]